VRRLALVLAAVLVVAACSGDDTDDTAEVDDSTTTTTLVEEPYAGYESSLYADGQHWLCRPDQEDVCDTTLDVTAVAADGSTEVTTTAVPDDPPVDCFYVYPTISADPGPQSDLETSPAQEGAAALNQAAWFSSRCRVFAPAYRQITLNAIGGGASEADRDAAYADVVDAWKEYVSHDNVGRGVVLIGHSQGSGHLQRLLAEEIEGVPALQDRLVSAVLLGSAVAVPEGEVVGGTFTDIPVCTAEGEVGCIVTWETYRSTDPPPPGAYFGIVEGPERAACTNPAALDGGPATLTPYWPTQGIASFSPTAADPAEITTPWVTFPDFLTGECVQQGEYDYLELTIAADPADPRTDDIPGDLTPPWGLHLVDANVAMGDLTALVQTQIEAYGA
jgi:pimeloyl-ACP methyl ester carboxylesterase